MHFDSLYPIQRAIAQAIADGNPITARELREAALNAVETALTMTPEEAERETDMITFDMAKQIWNSHTCDSQSNVCECIFEFPCQSCGRILKIQGESMASVIGVGGLCEMCFYRPDVRYPDNSLIAPHASE